MKGNAWLSVVALLMAAPVWCEDIGQVLHRSQLSRLELLQDAAPETPGSAALRQSFERLQRAGAPTAEVQLRVVAVGAIAETLEGRVVVVNAALGELPESCRLFLLAHELGHVKQMHWAKRIALYRQFIPGEVVQTETDRVAGTLGREASEQAHEQEYEADAYAMRMLLDLGYTRDELLDMFFRLGRYGDTATHPSSARRLAQLRTIEAERTVAVVMPPRAP